MTLCGLLPAMHVVVQVAEMIGQDLDARSLPSRLDRCRISVSDQWVVLVKSWIQIALHGLLVLYDRHRSPVSEATAHQTLVQNVPRWLAITEGSCHQYRYVAVLLHHGWMPDLIAP